MRRALLVVVAGLLFTSCVHRERQARREDPRKPARTQYVRPFDPELDRPVADLEALINEATANFTPTEAIVTGRLEAFSPMALPLPAMKCFVMVFRLGPGARLSDEARRGLALWQAAPRAANTTRPGADDTHVIGFTTYGPGRATAVQSW